MGASKSGHTREKLAAFLSERGFVPLRSGKGSHETWEHPELKNLAQKQTITPPSNLLANQAQKPWEINMPGDPASGTWKTISKHAEWCKETVEGIKANVAHEQRYAEICSQFRNAVKETCAWRKAVKNWVKAGLEAAEAPQAPLRYEELQTLKARKNQFQPGNI